MLWFLTFKKNCNFSSLANLVFKHPDSYDQRANVLWRLGVVRPAEHRVTATQAEYSNGINVSLNKETNREDEQSELAQEKKAFGRQCQRVFWILL